ncbi:MAG: hypothetical protein U0361_03395 [Nitrospiraceae bacterium]
MEISNNGRAADLARNCWGCRTPQRASKKKTESQDGGAQDRVQISRRKQRNSAPSRYGGTAGHGAPGTGGAGTGAVNAGTYTVDGKKVADSIIRNVLTDSIIS